MKSHLFGSVFHSIAVWQKLVGEKIRAISLSLESSPFSLLCAAKLRTNYVTFLHSGDFSLVTLLKLF